MERGTSVLLKNTIQLDLIFFYKCLNGLLNINLSKFIISRDTDACNLRNADLSFKIQYSRTNILKYSYFHRIVKAWNFLPLHVRKSESLNSNDFARRIFIS